MIINIYDAKSKLSQLLLLAQQGEEVIIARAGKPIATLTPIQEQKERTPGRLKTEITFSDGWDEPDYTEEELQKIEENLCEPY